MTTYSHKILLTGSHGQLGTALLKQSAATNFDIIPCTHASGDITKFHALETLIEKIQPTFIINAAAYTQVDKAESEQSLCESVNFLGAKNLAELSAKYKIPLLHISTDYVFAGDISDAYRETDATAPINYYGKTKLFGELAVQDHSDNYIILRVSGIFSEFGTNFLKTMCRLAKEKTELNIIADQFTCPTYAIDIANTIYQIIANFDKNKTGIYHYCNQEKSSWYNFARRIIEYYQSITATTVKKINPIPGIEYKSAALRPINSALNCEKIYNTFGITQQPWQRGIEQSLLALTRLTNVAL